MATKKFTPANTTPGPLATYPVKLEKIQNRIPGRWYELASFNTREGAKSALFRLRKKADEYVPKGKWEFACQRNGNTSRLMAKYQGPARTVKVGWWKAGKLVTEVPEEESKAKSDGAIKRWTGADKGVGKMTEVEKRRARKRARG